VNTRDFPAFLQDRSEEDRRSPTNRRPPHIPRCWVGYFPPNTLPEPQHRWLRCQSMGPNTGMRKMTKKKPKVAKSWRKLKKATKKAGQKDTKVGRSDVPLVSPSVPTDLI
jgi:hypothetical protein